VQAEHSRAIEDEVTQPTYAQQAQLQRAVNLERKIRDLGALPDEAYKKVRGKTMPQLKSLMKTVSAQVAKHSGNLNQKALDEFTSFKEQQASFEKRRKVRFTDRRQTICSIIDF
jgi:structural maintenance of chromosome 3 (chondroitin sulfate proteoglycan 6)